MTIFFVSCAQQSNNFKTVGVQDFKVQVEKQNAQILDVRSAAEYQSGHIKNALQANWNDKNEFESRIQHLEKQSTIYVYCLAGARSAAAATYLTEKGFNVVNLEGGFSQWKMNNFEVTGATSSTQMSISSFDKIIESNKLVLVDIGASWCPPCRKMEPVLNEIKKQYVNELTFLTVDGGTDIDVMKHVQFETLPTYIIYKNGKEVWRKSGIVTPSEFQNVLK